MALWKRGCLITVKQGFDPRLWIAFLSSGGLYFGSEGISLCSRLRVERRFQVGAVISEKFSFLNKTLELGLNH